MDMDFGHWMALESAMHGEQSRLAFSPRRCGASARSLSLTVALAGGCSDREIARRLVVFPRTAEHHVAPGSACPPGRRRDGRMRHDLLT